MEADPGSGAESVKVLVRCRPMNTKEKDMKCTKVISMESNQGKATIAKPGEPADAAKSFTFDAVFDTDSQQQEVYEEGAQALVESVLEGYNGTIFAYGQTGCGKSFSMMGVPSDAELMGIIPRAFKQIFSAIESNTVPGKQFLVQASYIEIYNEEVRDLINFHPSNRLELKEHPEKGVYVAGVEKRPVSSVEQITKLMEQGAGNRSVGATLMNADSSRSHSIFMVEIETSEPSPSGDPLIKKGVLNLVDLAGSERQGKTGASGQRLKEAAKINLSLSALGNVISALVAGKVHIPYRDSKLTRLLQNSLGGNAKTVMIAAISPAHYNYEETLSTLRYANRAKNIKNKPKVNEDPRDTLLREYQEEIKRLKDLLTTKGGDGGEGGSGGSGGGGSSGGIVKGSPEWEALMQQERERLIAEAKAEMAQLEEERRRSEEETKRMLEQLEQERAEQRERIRVLEEAQQATEGALKAREQKRMQKESRKSIAKGGAGKGRKAERGGQKGEGEKVDGDGTEGSPKEEEVGSGGGGEKESEGEGEGEGEGDENDDEDAEEAEKLEEQQRMLAQALQEEKEKASDIDQLLESKKGSVASNELKEAEEKERTQREAELMERLARLQSDATAKEELERRLKDMEQQLIEGGRHVDDVQMKAAQREEELRRLHKQAEREKREAEAKRQMMEEDITNAKGALANQTSRIKEMHLRIKQLQADNHDLQQEFETDRQDYLKTIRDLTKEVALYKAMAHAAYRPADVQLILHTARYDENTSSWTLPRITTPVVLPTVSVGQSQSTKHSSSSTSSPYSSSSFSSTQAPPFSARSMGFRNGRAGLVSRDASWKLRGMTGNGVSYSQHPPPPPPDGPPSRGRPHPYSRGGERENTHLEPISTPASHLSASMNFASDFPFAAGSRISPAESRSRAGTVGDRVPSRGTMGTGAGGGGSGNGGEREGSALDIVKRPGFEPALPATSPSPTQFDGLTSEDPKDKAMAISEQIRHRAAFEPARVGPETPTPLSPPGYASSSSSLSSPATISASSLPSPSAISAMTIPHRPAFNAALPLTTGSALAPLNSASSKSNIPIPHPPSSSSSGLGSPLDIVPRRPDFRPATIVPTPSSSPSPGLSPVGSLSDTNATLNAINNINQSIQFRAGFQPASINR